MEISKQCVGLELSKKLKKLGVKQDSYFDHIRSYPDKPYSLSGGTWRSDDEFGRISAFTVAELGEMLKGWIYECRCGGNVWTITAVNPPSVDKDGKPTYQTHSANTEADARAKMLIYLLENGLCQV